MSENPSTIDPVREAEYNRQEKYYSMKKDMLNLKKIKEFRDACLKEFEIRNLLENENEG
jgi:hypothetical protein